MRAATATISSSDRGILERSAERIRRFAESQRRALCDVEVKIDGGSAGHVFKPVATAGCYAPGGRYPLPSSVLMTAIPARVAGVRNVWVASPRPTPITLAAAAIAGADGVLTVGGAHAIAALAHGVGGVPACDMVVGPGNRWVTAAKYVISAEVGIDMLAGPSELLVLADESADAQLIAADLLAQAEHDADARPMLITTSPAVVEAVERELDQQLVTLPTAVIARDGLQNGFACVVESIESALSLCDWLAPEHLELQVRDPGGVAPRLNHFGALFIGSAAAEVFGDYGAGPNHTLPTGGTARFRGGLSVLSFLKCSTWLRIDDSRQAAVLARDAADFARLEQLEGHARSAARRI